MNGTNRNFGGAERKRSGLLMLLMLAAVMLTVLLLRVQPASAATMKTSAKPKFVVGGCKYVQENAVLSWKKVKGAKKYVIYRAAKKKGKYKKFGTTKELTFTKPSAGEFYYKVQAVQGKKKSKMSDPVHLFPAFGNIYISRGVSTTIFIGGFALPSGGGLTRYYSAVKNNSKKAMEFKKDASCQFIQYDPETGEIKKLGTGTLEDGATITPGQEDKITVKVSKKQYVDSGTVLVIQIPFKAGGLNWTLNIGRDPKNTWISALKK